VKLQTEKISGAIYCTTSYSSRYSKCIVYIHAINIIYLSSNSGINCDNFRQWLQSRRLTVPASYVLSWLFFCSFCEDCNFSLSKSLKYLQLVQQLVAESLFTDKVLSKKEAADLAGEKVVSILLVINWAYHLVTYFITWFPDPGGWIIFIVKDRGTTDDWGHSKHLHTEPRDVPICRSWKKSQGIYWASSSRSSNVEGRRPRRAGRIHVPDEHISVFGICKTPTQAMMALYIWRF